MTGRELHALLRSKNRTHQDFAAHVGRSTRTITRMVARENENVPRYAEIAARTLPTLVVTVTRTLVDADE